MRNFLLIITALCLVGCGPIAGGGHDDAHSSGGGFTPPAAPPPYVPTAKLVIITIIGQGTVSPRQSVHGIGEMFLVTATPATGWKVGGWIGTMSDASTSIYNYIHCTATRQTPPPPGPGVPPPEFAVIFVQVVAN